MPEIQQKIDIDNNGDRLSLRGESGPGPAFFFDMKKRDNITGKIFSL